MTGLDGSVCGGDGVVERKAKRRGGQAGSAHATNMLCTCVHHGLYCLRDRTHKSTKSHQRQDYQDFEKKSGASWNKLCCL